MDKAVDTDVANKFPTEFLNSLNPSGMSPHKLELKTNIPVMLLRNLNATHGLANGTRLIVKAFQSRVLDCEVVTGEHRGTRVFIPRINMVPSDSGLPFDLNRLQFPIKPAFEMTINKSQGQTLHKAGLYLPTSFSSHGQLHVALSRVGNPNNLKVLVVNGGCSDLKGVFTSNGVYPTLLP